MDNSLKIKVNRLNELYNKVESGNQLTTSEQSEQALLRDELINYFKFAVSKFSKNK